MPCGNCGEVGHGQKACPKRKGKACGYCKRVNGTHSEACYRARSAKPAARRSAKPARRAAAAPVPVEPAAPPTALVPVNAGARQLLREHVEEELAQKRAEVRVLESLRARLA
jgi:hypothetical protein